MTFTLIQSLKLLPVYESMLSARQFLSREITARIQAAATSLAYHNASHVCTSRLNVTTATISSPQPVQLLFQGTLGVAQG